MTFNAAKAIEMEHRHIREGEERVVQQQEIINRLDGIGALEAALEARKLLVEHRQFVDAAKARLAALQQRYPESAP